MKVAVIGSGISGLTCVHKLAERHSVTLYESSSYLGGHTNTHVISEKAGDIRVDSGFIVFNKKTYPNFLAMIEKCGVAYSASSMSFSVSDEKSGIEYNGTNLNKLFAQRSNLFRPRFYSLILGILKFNRAAKEFLQTHDLESSLGDFLKSSAIHDSVVDLYLIPMIAAVWSSDPKHVFDFPATFILRFFENHGFLEIDERPQWYVIAGGSQSYISKLCPPHKNVTRLNDAVLEVKRSGGNVSVRSLLGEETYDRVIFATHSDTSLALLADATDAERSILSSIPYTSNLTYLHTDEAILPRTKRAWAAWNYFVPKNPSNGATVTYNMNILQGLKTQNTYCVTLNPIQKINETKIVKKLVYHHPLFTAEGVRSQARWSEINGTNSTYFCGAYWRNGFHEDGVWSALRVVSLIDGTPI